MDVKHQISSTKLHKENTGNCIKYNLLIKETMNIKNKMETINENCQRSKKDVMKFQPSQSRSEDECSEQKGCYKVDVEAPSDQSTSISDNYKTGILENTYYRLVELSRCVVIQEEENYQFEIWEQYIKDRKEYQRKELLSDW